MNTKLSPYRPWWRIQKYLREGAVLQYAATGAIVFGADYAAFFACYQLLHLNLATATAIAYVVGFITNFILLRYWAFAKNAKRDYLVTSTLKYGVWLAVNYVITYLMLKYLQQWAGLSPYLGKFVVAFFMTFWNYAGYQLWVFRGPRSHKVRFRR